jgi:hypothetical protein
MQPSHPHPRVVYTFGDSILDCGHYNAYGLTPGGLLVTNQDALFPEFRGRDLSSRGPARLEHRARDGATLASLPAQARARRVFAVLLDPRLLGRARAGYEAAAADRTGPTGRAAPLDQLGAAGRHPVVAA